MSVVSDPSQLLSTPTEDQCSEPTPPSARLVFSDRRSLPRIVTGLDVGDAGASEVACCRAGMQSSTLSHGAREVSMWRVSCGVLDDGLLIASELER